MRMRAQGKGGFLTPAHAPSPPHSIPVTFLPHFPNTCMMPRTNAPSCAVTWLRSKSSTKAAPER